MPTLVNNLRAIRGPVTAVPMVGQSGVVVEPDNVNNQVVVRADETVLWEGDYTNSGSIALSESYKNFSIMAVYFKDNNNNANVWYIDTANNGGTLTLVGYSFQTLSGNAQLWIKPSIYSLANTSITYVEDNEFNLYSGTVRVNGVGPRIHILKIVGINRIANN